MKRTWILVLSLSIGLNAGLLVTVLGGRTGAAPPSEPPSERSRERAPHLREEFRSPQRLREEIGRRVRSLSDELGLTEEQTEALIEIRRSMFPKLIEGHERMAAIRDALREAYVEGTDAERIRAHVHQLNETRARIDSTIAEAMVEEAALLTPSQREGYLAAIPWGPGGGGPHDPPGHRHGRTRR